MYEALTARDPGTGDLLPGLATDWEQIDDHTWHFHIREGVQFHDGSALNAEVAAFGLDWTWNADRRGSLSIRGFMGPSMEFRAVDEYVLEITLAEPDPLLPTRLYASTIPSKKQIENSVDEWLTSPVGTGPYRFVEWDRGNHVIVERNEDWWGFGNNDAQGYPEYERATFLIRTENASRISGLRAGEVDFAERLTPDVCLAELDDRCLEAPASSIIFIKLDNVHPVLGDDRVRMAISHAMDREAIGEVILGGAQPASQLVSEGVTGFVEDLEPHEFNMDRARELLDEARADGVPVDSMPLRLIARQDSFPANDQVLEIVLESLNQLGITNVNASILEPSSFNPTWLTNYHEIEEDRGVMALHRHPDEWFDLAPTASNYFVCDGAPSSYCNPEADELYRKGAAATGEEREQYFQELSRIVYEDNPYIMMVNQPLFHGVNHESLEWSPRIDMSIQLKDMAPATDN
ncbi:hypothetical protein Q427_34270 [Halomonas sp. BC04]|nr:hypothetical protein Q427_34270 [Halomonas sp. BC04]